MDSDIWAIDPDTLQRHQLVGPQLEVYAEFVRGGTAPALAATLAWALEAPNHGGSPRVSLGAVLVTTQEAVDIVGCATALLQRKSNQRNRPAWWPAFYLTNQSRRVPVWWIGRLRNLTWRGKP